MPHLWFLLCGLLLCTAQVWNAIWISSPLTVPFTKADMDQRCSNESSGGIALVCTRAQNVSNYFSESSDIFTRRPGGAWDTLNPIARAGNVSAALFGGTNLLGTINDINGVNAAYNITHSCGSTGVFFAIGVNASCMGFYDGNVGYEVTGTSGVPRIAWKSNFIFFDVCRTPRRFYCLSSVTSAPTRTPTNAPTTKTPTNGPTTKTPTAAPTTTLSPTTSTPTMVSPTQPPSLAPSSAPTCSGCTITITPGNSSNTTVTIGPTSGPPVVITIPPTAIPNCSNCSVVIVLTPTPSGPSGGSGVVTIDVVDAGITRPNVSLEQPFTFFMPYSADLVGCTGPVVADCVWRDGTVWQNSGCSSQDTSMGTLCTCTHFTDFAVLLDESAPHPCQSRTDSSEVFFVLIACYALLFAYCVLAVFRLCYAGAKQSRGVMLLQHSLIGAVCVLRVLSCLNYLGTFGDAMGLSAFVAAAPYPLEYLLFTKFASTWAGLVHFSMLSTEARWKKIRPLFYAINVIGTCLAVGLFVMFYVESSFESALAGTVVLALLYLALATTFAVYATKLVKELAKVNQSSSSASSKSSRSRCGGVEAKIQLTGHLAAVCFVVQALCSVLALALPSEQLVGWTATFCFFNIVALLCILVVYSAAALKAPKATPRSYMDTSVSVSRTFNDPGPGATREMQPL